LVPSDFHFFPTLKEFLCVRRCKSNDEVEDAIKEWLNVLAAEVYDEDTHKLFTGYDNCLNVDSESVEKWLMVCNNDTLNYILFLFCLFFFMAKGYLKTIIHWRS
jgi:hypothetical protein